MAGESEADAGEALDRELAELLEVERFEPPQEFRERALLKDPAVYEQAAADPQAWWARQAEELHWFQRWTRVLDDDDPPFYRWLHGRHPQRVLQLPGPSCGGRQLRDPAVTDQLEERVRSSRRRRISAGRSH
jgi:Acetyl-coenzyme A synthetase N-terminus